MDNKTTLIKINIDNGAAIKRIADFSRQIDANKKHVKELQKAIKELDETSDDYAEQVQTMSEEIAATNAQTTELKRTMGDLNRTVANTVRENMNNEGSIKSLRAELSRLTDEYDSLGKAQREGTEGADLQARIASITDEIKGSEEATGRFYRNVGNYENAIKSALGLNQGFASSIMGIADGMGGVNGIIPGLKNNVAGLGGAFKALAANPVFLTIFGVTKIAEGVKFWFDFNKGLSEATRLTEQFTGLSGDALINYRDQVQAVADFYGKDFKEVMQSANTLAKQFGITYDEAIKIIQDGFVAGADVSGNFLDTVKEYPTFFREAGLSASEFVAISTEAVKQGVFSDKGVDAIKEATIRLREMTTATDEALAGIGLSGEEIQQAMADGTMTAFDAIQQVSAKLGELPDTSKEVGTAIADIFGGAGEDAGLQYIKTLATISTDLDEVKDKAGEYAQLQDDYLQSEIALQKATNELFGGMSVSFDDLLTKGKTFLNNVLAGIFNGILNFGAKAGATFASVKVYVSEAIKSLKSLGEVLKAVVTLQFDDIAPAWDKWISQVGDVGKQAGEAYAKAYNEAITKDAEATITGVKPSVKTIGSSGSDKVDEDVEPKSFKDTEDALKALERYEEQLRQIIIDNTYTAIEQVNARYDAEISELERSFEANKQYAESEEELERMKNEAITALNKARADEIKAINDKASDEAIKAKEQEYAALMRAEQERTENAKKEAEVRKRLQISEIRNIAEISGATAGLFSSLNSLVQATSESEEEATRRGRVLALAEIAFSTGEAIAGGVASAMSQPFPFNLPAIIATVSAVLANMATAIEYVEGARFSTGGLVTGEGTSTSDSIPALLSNGESVMTAEATAMFAPVLSAFNQIGGGVPIASGSTEAGENMLVRAFAKAIRYMPAPVVDVQEITRVSNQVQVLNSLSEA